MKSSSIEMSLGIEGRKGGQSVIGAGNVGREEASGQQRPQTRRNKLQHQSLQTVGSVINQSQSVVSRQGLLQSVRGSSLGGKGQVCRCSPVDCSWQQQALLISQPFLDLF